MSLPFGNETTPLLTEQQIRDNLSKKDDLRVFDDAVYESTSTNNDYASTSVEPFKSTSTNNVYKSSSTRGYRSALNTPYVSNVNTPYNSVANTTPYSSTSEDTPYGSNQTDSDALLGHNTDGNTSVQSANVEEPNSKNRKSRSKLDKEIKVYKKRWYILILFASLAFMQSELCNTWTVIAESVGAAFGWTLSEISLMQLWLYCMYLICVFPFTYLMEFKGLRFSMVMTAILTFTCSLLRCVSMTPPAVTWFNNIGACLLGMAGVVLFVCGPVISSIWFPPEQRSTATAVGTIAGFLGPAFCFLYGPMIVEEPVRESGIVGGGSHNYTNLGLIRHQIRTLRIVECGVCGILMVMTIVYFPSRPPRPPSRSAALPKLNFMFGIKSLFKRENLNFWFVCLAFSISTGIYGIFAALFNMNFKDIMSQREIGLMGSLSVSVGCVGAVAFGRLSDLVAQRMKLMAVVLMCGSVFSTYWILLLAMKYITLSRVQIYTAIVIQGLCINAPIPLFYEMAVESNYPIDEIVTSGMMSILYNIFPIAFLGIFFIPDIGTSWMNWCMYGSTLLCIPLILSFQERYKRLKVDMKPEPIIRVVE